jgi:hypothetical protein
MITLDTLTLDNIFMADHCKTCKEGEIRVYVSSSLNEIGETVASTLFVNNSHPLFEVIVAKFQVSFEDADDYNSR